MAANPPQSPERTSVSLLDRLRQPDDAEAWSRFVRVYSPLMFFWARRAGLQETDAADLVQDVFTILVQTMPSFVYNPAQSFRSWLRTILLNKLREHMRRPAPVLTDGRTLEDVAAPDPPDFLDDPQEREQLLRRALACLASEFQPKTWNAFRQTALGGKSPEEVAKELNVTVNTVYIARSRVMHRLREELDGLLP